LSNHEGLFLLKNALSVPKLLYLLRSSPCFGSRGAIRFDEAIRSALALVTNCLLSDEAWLQAALPVRWGGMGIRSISSLVGSAFLASAASIKILASSLLPQWGATPLNGLVLLAQADWLGRGGAIFQIPTQVNSQRAWDEVICGSQFEALVAAGSEADKARLLACRTVTSGCWLSALPLTSLKLRLGMPRLGFRLALGWGLRLF